MLLCLERARTKPKGRSINVGAGGLYFDRLVPVHVIEQRAGVTLPHAPATIRKKMASAVLDAIATELSNPTVFGHDPLRTSVNRGGPDSPICPAARQSVLRARPSTEFRRA